MPPAEQGQEPATQDTPVDAAGQPLDVTAPHPGVDPNADAPEQGQDPADGTEVDEAGQP